MAYYSLKDKEGTIINNVREDFFKEYDCRKLIGNIDFSVAIPREGGLFPEEYVLWAEAKQGDKHKLYESFIQLILTIGKERTIDKFLPPKFLGAFDAEKIAFIPYSAIMAVFAMTDFNWNVTPSDHDSKEFKLLKEIVKEELSKANKEKDNVFVFDFFNDKKDLIRFIKSNFVSGRDDVRRIRINQNNFTHIYDKWRREVKPTIDVKWENVKTSGLLDADFFLADVMAKDNVTLQEKLHVLLKSNQYELDREYIEGFLRKTIVEFTDNMRAHTIFWSKYARPPREEYQTKILNRRDLLVPQDVRERKGSYFTPKQWVELSQEYLAKVLGEDWQDEYYVWDCCAGTGNLLKGLSNKYNIWASTLDKADVKVMLQDIESVGEQNSHLLASHVFQFDFLNDDFDKLPEGLRDIINDEEKRKKLVIYINPPYAEAASYRTITTKNDEHKIDVAVKQKTYERYLESIGIAGRELFVQFLTRIYTDIKGSIIAHFSTLKILQAPNFSDFRSYFQAKLKSLFVVPANTFDNVKGAFPIGFYVWDTTEKELFSSCIADIFTLNNREPKFIGQKLFHVETEQKSINDWLIATRSRQSNKVIAFMACLGADFQHANLNYIVNKKEQMPHPRGSYVTNANLTEACIYLAVRHCIEATWLNDRDQFLTPNESWKYDRDFQSDCLAFTLFHGQNHISSEQGTNHWIPFTEHELGAPDNLKSHFMSDFIAGKLASKTLFGDNAAIIPDDPIQFTPVAQAVMDAGRKIWIYYMKQKPKTYGAEPINVNASFYDIRAYFQGRDEKGKMNNDSKDETYMALLRELRTYQKVLAKQIERKVYQYGFLKGEVAIDPQEQVVELKNQVATLESRIKELQKQPPSQFINNGTVNFIDNSRNYNIK